MLALSVDIRDRLPKYSEALRLLDKAIAHDMTTMTQAHLRALGEARPNELGGRSSRYYEQAALNTRGDATPGEIKISIQQIGMNLHYHGGTVFPKVAKWLGIPATAETYGKRAREFDNLKFVKFSDTLAALLVGKGGTERFDRGGRKAVKGAGKSAAGKVMYWLKKSTEHQPDHTVIPNENAFYESSSRTVTRVCEALRESGSRRTIGGAI